MNFLRFCLVQAAVTAAVCVAFGLAVAAGVDPVSAAVVGIFTALGLAALGAAAFVVVAAAALVAFVVVAAAGLAAAGLAAAGLAALAAVVGFGVGAAATADEVGVGKRWSGSATAMVAIAVFAGTLPGTPQAAIGAACIGAAVIVALGLIGRRRAMGG